MPQTRFVTMKALKLGLSPIVVVNKVDRPGARPEGVVNQTFELFDRIGATDTSSISRVYASARTAGRRSTSTSRKRTPCPQAPTCARSSRRFSTTCRPPCGVPDEPLQFQVAALDYSSYVGRLGIGRIRRGRLAAGQEVAGLNGPLAEGQVPPRRGSRSLRVRRHGARAGRNGAGGRHRARHRHRRAHDRHDALVAGSARGLATDHGRRADAVDVLPGEHVASRRAATAST